LKTAASGEWDADLYEPMKFLLDKIFDVVNPKKVVVYGCGPGYEVPEKYRPITSSTRGRVRVFDDRASSKNDPLKSALNKKTSTGGRNNVGRTTSRF